MRIRTVFWGFFLLLISASVQAEAIPDLYIAEVPVQSQDREERELAIGTALQSVLVRVSGRNLVLTVPEIETSLTEPTRYVQRYRYVKRKNGGVKQQHLWVRFDEKAVNKLLRDNQLPVWGKVRPTTLLWLVIDDRKGRKLITNDKEHEARSLIESQARLRGVPIRLPLYDLADRAKLGVTDVWGNFEDRILEASSRYQTEAVLVGRVYKSYGNSWSGRWSLYSEGRRQDWESNGESLELALLPGVGYTADSLAQQYARGDEAQDEGLILVRVVGVESLKAYNKAVSYLDSLEVVSEVKPRDISIDSVVFELTSRRGRLAVSQAISLGHALVAEAYQPKILPGVDGKPVQTDEPSTIVDLNYRLVP